MIWSFNKWLIQFTLVGALYKMICHISTIHTAIQWAPAKLDRVGNQKLNKWWENGNGKLLLAEFLLDKTKNLQGTLWLFLRGLLGHMARLLTAGYRSTAAGAAGAGFPSLPGPAPALNLPSRVPTRDSLLSFSSLSSVVCYCCVYYLTPSRLFVPSFISFDDPTVPDCPVYFGSCWLVACGFELYTRAAFGFGSALRHSAARSAQRHAQRHSLLRRGAVELRAQWWRFGTFSCAVRLVQRISFSVFWIKRILLSACYALTSLRLLTVRVRSWLPTHILRVLVGPTTVVLLFSVEGRCRRRPLKFQLMLPVATVNCFSFLRRVRPSRLSTLWAPR